MTYFDKLRAAYVARDSLLCIGLDPEPAVIAGGLDGAVDFCRSLVERTSDLACCYKPNAAPQGLGGARHREAVRAAGRARAAGRTDLQHPSSGVGPLFMAVAQLAVRCNDAGNIGVVMGATAPVEAAAVRAAFPGSRS